MSQNLRTLCRNIKRDAQRLQKGPEAANKTSGPFVSAQVKALIIDATFIPCPSCPGHWAAIFRSEKSTTSGRTERREALLEQAVTEFGATGLMGSSDQGTNGMVRIYHWPSDPACLVEDTLKRRLREAVASVGLPDRQGCVFISAVSFLLRGGYQPVPSTVKVGGDAVHAVVTQGLAVAGNTFQKTCACPMCDISVKDAEVFS